MKETYHLNMEMGGRVTVMVGENGDDWFDYHQTHHTVCGMNWASDEAQSIMNELEMFIDMVVNQVGEAA
jgi:hypothetical protein